MILRRMIDTDVFKMPYFKNSNWIQIFLDVCDQEALYSIFDFVQEKMSDNNWYFFYKNQMVHIKILVQKRNMRKIESICKWINENSKNCCLHTFEPEYYQFGGVESWEYLVKWFNLCTKVSFTNDSPLIDTAYSIVSGLLNQLDYTERELTISHLLEIRKVGSITKYDNSVEPCSIVDVEEYRARTSKKILYPYPKIWPFVVIFIMNIFRINLNDQKMIIAALS